MRILPLVMLLCVVVSAIPAASYELELARDATTPYQIVTAQNAPPQVAAVAVDFAEHFQQITDAEIPIATDEIARREYEILIRPSRHLRELFPAIEWDKYQDEEYLIRTVDHSLILTGGKARGTPNAVYTFLEDQLACRWYTPEFSVIPQHSVLTIPALYIRRTPDFEARKLSIFNAADATWAARQRLNFLGTDVRWARSAKYGQKTTWSDFEADPKLGGSWVFSSTDWRGEIHTLGKRGTGGFLTEEDFKDHPEWFRMIDGGRSFEAQPCFSNPEVPLVIAERAKQWLRRTGTRIISVSQGDYDNLCTCQQCQTLYETFTYPVHRRADGGLTRPDFGESNYRFTRAMIQFVSKVAAEIVKEFPEVRVHTFAYNWSLCPPREITVHPNVVVEYANLCACVYHTLEGCTYNEGLHCYWSNVERWVQRANHVWLWWYDHPGGLHPYPNLAHLGESFRQWRDAGISGVRLSAQGGIGTLTASNTYAPICT